MLYYFLAWLHDRYDITGFGVFQYLSFRAALSVVFSLIISLLIGGRIIRFLQKKQIGEVVRTGFGPDHAHKKGTPTMGGMIILAAIIIPTLLWSDIKNAYVWLILLATVWMGCIGFIDDYIKVFKKDKRGLSGKFKIVGQVSLGLIVGLTMLFHPDFQGARNHITQLNIVKPDVLLQQQGFQKGDKLVKFNGHGFASFPEGDTYKNISTYTLMRTIGKGDTAHAKRITLSVAADYRYAVANTLFGPRDRGFIYRTDFPFFKSLVFDYSHVWGMSSIIPKDILGRIIYLFVVIFIVTGVSNAVNLTDGIDGLAAGTSAITGMTLGLFAYLGGNVFFANYLNITYIPLSAELIIYSAAFVGGCAGFLWYNTYPAQVFMGDTGSLALGGALGVMSLMVKKELLLPILCGVFFAETLSVMLQVSYFKYLKRKHGVEYAQQHRLFRMSPLHHHFEKGGMHEAKIVNRFFIVAIMLAVTAVATLKLR